MLRYSTGLMLPDEQPVSWGLLSRCLLAVLLAALTGCKDPSSAIAKQFTESGRTSVDLASAVPGDWDRVCILAPYSDNAIAAKTLGFEWPVESHSNITLLDSITLLIFVQGNRVAGYTEHPRDSGDFSNLGGRCFSQHHARFVQVNHPAEGWPGLFPADEK